MAYTLKRAAFSSIFVPGVLHTVCDLILTNYPGRYMNPDQRF